MSAIIYQASAPPWKTARQTVQTFPSGLMRVDQEYVVPTATQASYFSAFASGAELTGLTTPALDGVYIYPDPQWVNNGDGTTSIQVSAYGRTKTGIQDVFLTPSTFQATTNIGAIQYKAWNITGSIVIPSGTTLGIDDLFLDPEFFLPFDFAQSARPTLNEFSVVEIGRTNRPQYNFAGFGNTSPTGQIISPTSLTPKTRVRYRVELTLDGTQIFSTVYVWLDLPEIQVVRSTNFGKFTELEISTSRGSGTYTLT